MAPKTYRYEQIVSKLEEVITSLHLQPGDKLPSARKISQDMKMSLSTVFQAFAVLEAKGLIISRPRSGYYINSVQSDKNDIPAEKFIPMPVNVSLNKMATTMLKNAKEYGIINFSTLAPANEFLPVTKINKAVQASLKKTDSDNFQYSMVEGHPRLLKQIARNTFDWKKNVSSDQILITNGCMEAINLCLDAVTQPGDVVIIESPAYHGILQSLAGKKLKVIEIPSDPETGLNLTKLKAAIAVNKVSACVLSVVCGNPSGGSMPEDHKIKLVKLLGEKNIPLIEDDALGELSFAKSRPKPAKAYDEYDNVLYCSSFSKSLAPGFRIGWVTAGKYHAKVEKLKFSSNISTTGILQDAIGRFLESGHYERHIKLMRNALHRQVLKYMEAITLYFPKDIKMTTPSGGFSLWITLPETIDAMVLQKLALSKKIGVCPGQIFSVSSCYSNFIRFNCCPLWNTKVENAIKTLGELIEKSR